MSIHPNEKPRAKATVLDQETRERLKDLEMSHARVVSDSIQGFMQEYMQTASPGPLEQNASLRGMLASLTQLSVMMQHLLVSQHGYEPDDLADWMNANAHQARAQLIRFEREEQNASEEGAS